MFRLIKSVLFGKDGMRVQTTSTFLFGCVLVVASARPGRADSIENLVFAGTATCVQVACSSVGNGALTGSYTLDVTTQKIVGAWSFTTPFGVISSSDKGALASVQVYRGDNNVLFDVNTNTPLFSEFVQFFFPITDTLDLGPLDTNVNSDACQNKAGGTGGSASCYADYTITGENTTPPVRNSTPEPSAVMLFGLGVLGFAGTSLKRCIEGQGRVSFKVLMPN